MEGQEETFENERNIPYFGLVVKVLYRVVETHQLAHLNLVNFTVFQLDHNKDDSNIPSIHKV